MSQSTPDNMSSTSSSFSLAKYKSTVTVGIVALLGIGVASAAYLYGGGASIISGESVEKYLPKDATAAIQINLASSETKTNFQKMIGQLTKDSSEDNWKKWIKKSIEETPAAPADKEIAEFIASVRKAVGVISTPKDEAIAYAAIAVSDGGPFDAVVEKLKSVPGYTTESYNGHTVLAYTQTGIFAAREENTVLVASSKIALQQLLDRTFDGNSLAQSEEYDEKTKATKNAFLSAYLKPAVFLQLANQSPALENDPAAKAQLKQVQESLKFLQAISFGVDIESDGLALSTLNYGNREIMDSMQFKFSDMPKHDAYLAGTIPGGNTIYYSEGYNLNKSFSSSLKISPITSTEEFAELIKQIQGSLEALGLNLKSDVYPLFEKGTALAFQTDTENIFPRLTLVTDIGSNEESAKKVLNTLGTTLEALIGKLKAGDSGTSLPDGVITKSISKVGAADFMVVKLNIATIAPLFGAEIPEALKKTLQQLKIELWMGISENKYLILSTTSDLGTRPEKNTIATDSDFQSGIRKVGDNGQGIGYVHFGNAIQFIDRVYRLAVSSGLMTSDPNATFSKFSDAIKPLKYVFFTASAEDYTSATTGFIKIGEDK